MASGYVLGVDQGTSGTVAVLLDDQANITAFSDTFPVSQHYPREGWAETDPAEILEGVEGAMVSAVRIAGIEPRSVRCCGLANQGETVIAFDRQTGEPAYPAVSWQDRRGAESLAGLNGRMEAEELRRITGLLPSTYFSAPKMRWLLDNVEEVRRLASAKRLCLATSDSWLLHRLLESAPCLTDVSTASRTLLFDISGLRWDERLLDAFSIPADLLPEVIDSSARAGALRPEILGAAITVGGLCVDQQAALFGHGCLAPGATKMTYGTGCFVLTNLGRRSVLRPRGLLTSVAWRLGGEPCYVADGGVYCAGSLVRWLIEDLGLAASIQDLEKLIGGLADSSGVCFVPALAGLAAPYWRPDVAGSWQGLSLATSRAHLARAAVESVAFRVKDIIDALEGVSAEVGEIRVDGGMSGSSFLMQFQADLLRKPLRVLKQREATALGAALMAGIAAEMWGTDEVARRAERSEYATVIPNPANSRPAESYRRWRTVMRGVTEAGV